MNKRVYYHIAPLTVQILIVKQRCGKMPMRQRPQY